MLYILYIPHWTPIEVSAAFRIEASFFHHFIWPSDALLTPSDHVTGLQLVISKSQCVAVRANETAGAKNSTERQLMRRLAESNKSEEGWPTVRVTQV